jgi:putative transposase
VAELTEVSEPERQVALQRFQTLRPHLEDGVPLAAIAHHRGLALRTLQRWVQHYQQNGLLGLARQSRSDRDQHRLSDPLRHLIEGLALQKPPPSIATIHRRVTAIAQQQGWPPPSYSTVRRVVTGLDDGLLMLAHQGSKAYREAFDLLYRREATQANDIWQADHTPLPLYVLDERGEPVCPWLTVILDDFSRAVAGYYLSLENPSTLNTALALRQAIWRKADPRWRVCGIPSTFYTDHGSDFTSQHMEQVSADLKMRLVFSTIGMPRGRGRIERFFLTVEQLFLCELPGYAPTGRPVSEPVLTLNDLDTLFRDFVLDHYHQRGHEGIQQPPQALWEANSFLPQLPESLAQLDLLLLTVARSRRVRQEGIRFQNLWYSDLTLSAYVGEDVTIRYDPRDMAEIRVYHRNAFLCRAVCQELAGQTLSLKELIRHRNARRRELQGVIKDRRQIVETYLKVHQSAPPAPRPPSDVAPDVLLKRYFNE